MVACDVITDQRLFKVYIMCLTRTILIECFKIFPVTQK